MTSIQERIQDAEVDISMIQNSIYRSSQTIEDEMGDLEYRIDIARMHASNLNDMIDSIRESYIEYNVDDIKMVKYKEKIEIRELVEHRKVVLSKSVRDLKETLLSLVKMIETTQNKAETIFDKILVECNNAYMEKNTLQKRICDKLRETKCIVDDDIVNEIIKSVESSDI